MLTLEILQQDETLKALAPEVLSHIASMSQNDEASVIGTKIGELHGKYDADVLSVTGIAKNQGEKSYDYVKRVLSTFKADADNASTVKSELDTAKQTIATLTAQVEKGGDEAIKRQLNDYKGQVSQLQQQLQTKEASFEQERTQLQTQLRDTKINTAFQTAISGMKFKSSITDGVKQMVLASAKAEVLAKGTPEFADDGSVVFRDDKQQIIRNAKNGLNPSSFTDLLLETSLKDIIDTGRKQAGGGTRTPEDGGNGSSEIELDGVKTQLEADQRIANYLLAQGITRDSDEFAQKSLELRTENNVAQLPIR